MLARLNWTTGLLWLVCLTLAAARAHGQAGLRESLERLDRNGNGEIEPSEITPLARPYLERIAEGRRLSLDRSNDIESLQEAARVYFALRNGVADRDVDVRGASSVKPFEPDSDEVLIPEFGLAEVKYPYTSDDMREASRMLRRSDRNRDGFIDREEAQDADWQRIDPFSSDLNGDDRLSRMELTQRYARRRLLENASGELIKKALRTGNGIRPAEPRRSENREDRSSWWRRRGLAYSMLERFDLNRNGRLEPNESQDLGLPVGRIDIDRDGDLSSDELSDYLNELQDETSSELEGIPGWFYELDENKDNQVSMDEFSTDWSDEQFAEFANLDANKDGLLTAQEVASSKAVMGGSYASTEGEILPPGKTVISEIIIDDDFIVRDVNVQLSITHTNVASLDIYLTGPDGERIELATEVGGSGDHFDKTTFDDQAELPIVKGQAPFAGSFLPEGLLRQEAGLKAFNDKNGRGVWQLVVRGTRSDRFGMLNNWSLAFQTKEDLLSKGAAATTEESSAN